MKRGLTFLWTLPSILLVGLMTWKWRHYQLDDALIYMRYVRNALNGNGLVYNPGERFNGLTSPLYTLSLVLTSAVTRNPQVATILLSAVGLIGAAILGAKLFTSGNIEAAFASSLIAITGFFYFTFGMESTMLLALISATLLLARRLSPWLVPVAALAVSTRVEAIFLVVPVGAFFLYKTRKLPRIAYLAGGSVILLAPYLFNLYYYGALLPGTASAKFAQGASGYWGRSLAFLNVGYLLNLLFGNSLFAFHMIAILSLLGVWTLGTKATARLSFVYLALLAGFYLMTNMPNYHWYYAPFIYFLLLYFASGIAAVIRIGLVAVRGRRFGAALISLALLAAGLAAIPNLTRFAGGTRNESYAQIGRWLQQNTQSNASVALVEIGTVGWYSERPIVDILGLANGHNAQFIANRDLYSWMDHYQPDFILCHDPNWELESSCALAVRSGLYSPTPSFSVPGFALLARKAGVSNEEIVNAVEALRPR